MSHDRQTRILRVQQENLFIHYLHKIHLLVPNKLKKQWNRENKQALTKSSLALQNEKLENSDSLSRGIN